MNKIVLMTAIVVIAASAINTRGQTTNPATTSVAPALPDRLPIGDERTFRSHIVSKNGLVPNVDVMIGYNDNGNWIDHGIGKYTPGYDSYDQFVADANTGLFILLDDLKKAPELTAYPPGTDIYATVLVTYFNDMVTSPIYSAGLWIDANLGPLETMTMQAITNAFSLSSTCAVEQVVIPVPNLNHLQVVVQTPEATKTLGWSSAMGLKASDSWPALPPNDTASGYVVLDQWFSVGAYPVRITISTTNGTSATYTQYGDRIVPPKLSMIDSRNFALTVPRGADVTVYSSSDLKNWTLFSSMTSVVSNELHLPINGGERLFFKASCQ